MHDLYLLFWPFSVNGDRWRPRRETWGGGEGADPVGSDGGRDAAAGWNRPAVRVWLRGGSPAVPTAGRAAGNMGHPGVRGGPHRRPRALLPPLGRLLRGQHLPLLMDRTVCSQHHVRYILSYFFSLALFDQ